MHEEENSSRSMGLSKRRQMKDPPSIPFLWETKPGIPKQNWTPHSILKINLQTPEISFSNSSFQGISDDDDDDDEEEEDDMLGFDDTISCTTDESFSTEPSNPESLSSKAIFEANISGRSSRYPTAFTTIRPDLLIRKPHTLAELMMMSRRLSCRRKAIHIRKSNQPMEILKNNFFGCFIPRRLHQRRITGQN